MQAVGSILSHGSAFAKLCRLLLTPVFAIRKSCALHLASPGLELLIAEYMEESGLYFVLVVLLGHNVSDSQCDHKLTKVQGIVLHKM